MTENIILSPNKTKIDRILRADVSIKDIEEKIVPDKVIVKGNANINMTYCGVDDSGVSVIEKYEFDLPFSQIVDMQGITPANEDITTNCNAYGCDISNFEDGTSFDCDILLITECKTVTFKSDILCDVYSAKNSVDIEKSIEINSYPSKEKIYSSQKTSIPYEETDISTVYDCYSKVIKLSSRLLENKNFLLYGTINYVVIAQSADLSPVYLEKENFEVEIPMMKCILLLISPTSMLILLILALILPPQILSKLKVMWNLI